MPTNNKTRFAYLVSRYPSVSHTFIAREVASLRALGFEIYTASINTTDIPDANLTPQDREEINSTLYVKKQGLWGTLRALLDTFAEQPVNYFKALWFALNLGPPDIKMTLYNVFYLAEAIILGRWMQKNDLHHIHVHFANPAATVALIASHLFPITFSMSVHGPDDFYDITRLLIREKIEGARFIFCISFFTQSQLMLLAPTSQWEKFFVSRLGVNPDIYTPRPLRQNPEKIQLICVGRLAPAKGQLLLLKALRQLNRPVHLKLVGDGPERPQLEQYVKQNGLENSVQFLGALNQDQTRAHLQTADILVLASFAEGLPVALMEAMSMEIPCIATGINGIPELIVNEINGLLVPPSDEEGLVKAIATLCDQPEKRLALGQNGRKEVMKNYNLATNTRHLADLFEQCLANDRRPT